MKGNKIKNKKRRNGIAAVLVITALVLLVAGTVTAYRELRALWIEQFRVTDISEQVLISSGKMVKADVVAENFGLRNGTNLALIDFDEKRRKVLEKIPNLKSISVVRRQPGTVTIVTEERVPIARMNVRRSRSDSGRVVDSEGVVFLCSRGTRMLPVIREASAPGTGPGKILEGRAAAALLLIDICRDPEFQELGILEVDISKQDFLMATLGGDYSTVKIAWEGMDTPSPASKAALARRLKHLLEAIRSRVGHGAVTWNVTDLTNPGRIYADTKNNIR